MKISGGLKEGGIVVGNTYDKYGSRNLIVRWIMQGFDESLNRMVAQSSPKTIHEVGCGEGFWTLHWNAQGVAARGSDFSRQAIDLARLNARDKGVSPDIFQVRSIYDVRPEEDSADLVVCCEVLEHLEEPEKALTALQGIVTNHLVISVPREPIWCLMNLARGKYTRHLGNTPGHIQHWSSRQLIQLTSRYFQVLEVRTPLPWTMLFCHAIK